jgi:hypothetical protein
MSLNGLTYDTVPIKDIVPLFRERSPLKTSKD